MSGIEAHPEGITYPPIDDLIERTDSRYGLVIYAAKRARQINSYNRQLEANMLRFVGPVVPVEADDKPLSIALRELVQDKLELHGQKAASPAAK